MPEGESLFVAVKRVKGVAETRQGTDLPAMAKPGKAVSRGIPLATALQDAAAGTEGFGTARQPFLRWQAVFRATPL